MHAQVFYMSSFQTAQPLGLCNVLLCPVPAGLCCLALHQDGWSSDSLAPGLPEATALTRLQLGSSASMTLTLHTITRILSRLPHLHALVLGDAPFNSDVLPGLGTSMPALVVQQGTRSDWALPGSLGVEDDIAHDWPVPERSYRDYMAYNDAGSDFDVNY